MKAIRIILALLFMAALCVLPASAQGLQRPHHQHITYFAHTPDELNVYRVYGADDGKTLMIIGGIQGDEPGGFLSADLYADISLAKGNLIVVPRANFFSIIMKHRGPDGDMNRQFGDPVTAKRHKKIVQVLKGLMAESDLFLNLHDGSGFYRPTWEGPMQNPKRYGQSLIADTAVFEKSDGGTIDMQAMAESVLARVNPQIKDKRYHLLFNNHRTANKNSIHKEQRRSATYYALKQCNIPAFGVETSKSLPNVAMKVRHHNLVINAFMEELGIEVMNPGLYVEKPVFKYLVISVNDALPVVVTKDSVLEVAMGDKISVLHIEANRERGLSCDVIGQGSVSDLRHAFSIQKPTKIVIRKDFQKIGQVKIVPDKRLTENKPTIHSKRLYFLVEALGQRRMVAAGEKIRLVKGDELIIVDLISNLADQRGLEVNFKGFVPAGQKNTGEDRGFRINTSEDLLPRFSRCASSAPKNLECYPVIAQKNGRNIGEIQVEIVPATMDYVVVSQGKGPKRVYFNGETISAGNGGKLEIIDVKTNVSPSGHLRFVLECGGRKISLAESSVDPSSQQLKDVIKPGKKKARLLVLRKDQAIGEVGLDLGGN